MANPALCTIPDCGKPISCRGVCRGHYIKHLRGAPIPLAPKRIPNSHYTCSVHDCDRPCHVDMLCSIHWQRRYKTGSVELKWAKRGEALKFCQQAANSDTSDCIIWPFKLKEGYGFVRPPVPGQRGPFPQMKASRYVCILAHGPANGLHALHTCHDSRCVNPAHLYWGTNDRNILDKLEAGRQCRGSDIYGTKLTEDQVREIKRLDLSGYKSILSACRELGPKYGVSPYTIKGVLSGHNWRHIT